MAKKPTRFTATDGKLVLTLDAAEEGGYIVRAPFDPDVLTQAETLEEAFENARDVMALFEEERKAVGAERKPASRRKKQKAG